jgi:ArsR family transcriptional regulator, zinc-responsive transcriptional repressor
MKVEEIQFDEREIINNLDAEKLEKVSFILKTIAHPLRISIISLLVSNEKLCVNDICELMGSEQSLTSHHLSNMKLSGILGSVREGKNIYYFLKLKEVVTVINCMNKCDLI